MWFVKNERMKPVIAHNKKGQAPWHSTPYQALPEIFTQNASLEIAWTRVPLEVGTIAGNTIRPFFTKNHEGFDINTPEDWVLAEHLIKTGVKLPKI